MKRLRTEEEYEMPEPSEEQVHRLGAVPDEFVRSSMGLVYVLTLDLGSDVDLDEIINPKYDQDPMHTLPVTREAWKTCDNVKVYGWHVGEPMVMWMREAWEDFMDDEFWALRGSQELRTPEEDVAGEVSPPDTPVCSADLRPIFSQAPNRVSMADLMPMGLWSLDTNMVFGHAPDAAFFVGHAKFVLRVRRKSLCSLGLSIKAATHGIPWPPRNVVPPSGDVSDTRWPNDPVTQETAAIMPFKSPNTGRILLWWFMPKGREEGPPFVEVEYAATVMSRLQRPQDGTYRDAVGNLYSQEMVKAALHVMMGPQFVMTVMASAMISQKMREMYKDLDQLLVIHVNHGRPFPPEMASPHFWVPRAASITIQRIAAAINEAASLPPLPQASPVPPTEPRAAAEIPRRRRGRPRGSGRGAAAPRARGRRERRRDAAPTSIQYRTTPADVRNLFRIFWTNEAVGRQVIMNWRFIICMSLLIPPAGLDVSSRDRVERFVDAVIDNNCRLTPGCSRTSTTDRDAAVTFIISRVANTA